MMARMKALVLAGLAITVSATAFPQSADDGTLASSERMIARCLDYAAREKLTPLSVGVIDASGALIAFQRQDGANAVTAEAALLKARTALRLNVSTDVLAPALAADASARDAFLLMQLTTLPGGAPFADAQGRPAGAIGVSGALPAHDAECARRAIGSGKAGD
jgi:glc operon protein GlcG